MKMKLLFYLFIIGNYSTKAQYTAIHDAYFEQALISQGYDSGAIDHQVLTANINKITTLNVSNKSIADLTGIKDFVALTNLNCDGDKLSGLDVSGLTNLQTLSCGHNQLTSLNVSGLTALTYLNFYNNKLTSVNFNGLTALKELYSGANELTSLNVSELTTLKELYCGPNQLTSLNLSALTALKTVYCYNNELTSLNLSGLTALTDLVCEANKLTSLNVKGLTALTVLYCANNPSLSCIQVNDIAAATENKYWFKDAMASYSTNCSLATSKPLITSRAVTVFPNPAKEVLNIKSNGLIIQTEIYDTNGRKVLSLNQNSENIVLNIGSLVNGLYFVTVKTQANIYRDRFIKR